MIRPRAPAPIGPGDQDSGQSVLVRSPQPTRLVQLVLLPFLFYVGVKLSLALAVMPEVVVMLWLPNGLLLVALLHYHMRRYVCFAALIVLAEIAADYPTFSLIEATLFGAINLIEVTVAYLLLKHWQFDPRFVKPIDLGKFLIAGPGVGAFVAACGAAAIYSHFRGIEVSFFQFQRIWWFSDAVGLMIVVPLALSLWPPKAGVFQERLALRWFDGIAAVLALAVITVFLLSDKGMFHGVPVRTVQMIPFVLYAAARLTPRATTIVLVIFAMAFLFVTKNGQQPFGDLPIRDTVLLVQQAVLIMTVTSLGLAALLSQLRANTRELEARVQKRTSELREANELLQRLALTDPLTGALNRRALFDLMGREMERHRRHRHELAVIMFDVDRFKQVNDCYGHAVGDQVLRHVTEVAAKTVRGTDTLARYGGEEFVLVAAETDRSEALLLAERVREALRSSDVPLNEVTLRVTASFGVALMRADDTEPGDVLRRADEALYAAKFAGRDRVGAETSATGKAQTRSCEVELRSEGSGRAQVYLRRMGNPR